MTLLEVSGLSKSYARRRNLLGRPRDYLRAVHNVSFSVRPHETVALVGESGAGKSTVGRLILRLIEPDAGAVSFEGVDVLGLRKSELRTLRQRMQMIFQDPYSSLDPHVTVGESIGEPLLVHFGMKAGERRERAISLLKHIGMDEGYADRLPRELSGGQLQRAAIARALTLEPKLIICDEPVAALDLSIRAQVLNLMKQLQEEMGIAFLFVSHDLGLVRAMADRVMVMYRGEIVEEGATAEIFSDAKHEYTRTLLAAMPRIRRWQADAAMGASKTESPSLAAAERAANPG